MASLKTVKVEDEALQALKDAVYARYGRIYGVLSDEASAALRDHAARLRAQPPPEGGENHA